MHTVRVAGSSRGVSVRNLDVEPHVALTWVFAQEVVVVEYDEVEDKASVHQMGRA